MKDAKDAKGKYARRPEFVQTFSGVPSGAQERSSVGWPWAAATLSSHEPFPGVPPRPRSGSKEVELQATKTWMKGEGLMACFLVQYPAFPLN